MCHIQIDPKRLLLSLDLLLTENELHASFIAGKHVLLKCTVNLVGYKSIVILVNKIWTP